jgi:hypothetical protein
VPFYASADELGPVIERWVAGIQSDPEIAGLCQGLNSTIDWVMTDLKYSFHTSFVKGQTSGGVGKADPAANVHLEMDSDVFDQMMSGRLDGAAAAMSGQLSFSGDMTAAMGLQGLLSPLERLYRQAKMAEA